MTAPIYALVGADSFLQLQEMAQILTQLPADVARVDLDGERAALAEVLDELNSFAMFGSGKVVVIRQADELLKRFREPLEEYATHPSASATLVLRLSALPRTQRIYKAIAKVGEIRDCQPPRQLDKWILQRGKTAHAVALSPDAASLLADLIGDDLGRLDNELAKLALVADGKNVDARLVDSTTSFQREQEMWDLTNALAIGDTAQALQRWRHLVQLDSSAEFRAVTWLTMWLEDVRAVVMQQDTSKLTWKYKDRLARFTANAMALGRDGLRRAVNLLADIDLQSKSGVGDAVSNIERFVITLSLDHRARTAR